MEVKFKEHLWLVILSTNIFVNHPEKMHNLWNAWQVSFGWYTLPIWWNSSCGTFFQEWTTNKKSSGRNSHMVKLLLMEDCHWHPGWGDEPNSFPSSPLIARSDDCFPLRIWNIEFARTNRLFGPQCWKWGSQKRGWLAGWALRVCGNFTKQFVEFSFWHF